ncbi:ATP-dependent DNA helicase PIF1-like [Malus sylvestris]|uniref:ATP-dependent DNA helicase PIF1-like n=1 Tax=Malus sylvestris TaxID=3752 RepID=UPI0021AC04CC|nr:ATP-dependent DNA helicase PIF1-like [Malus sylvestris]
MEIPSHYIWIQAQRKWSKRMNRNKVIGRIYAVSPAEGEKFYLRILLNHVRGPISFTNLRTVNGVLHPTYKQAAKQRGLLERDNSIRQCLLEASTIQMSSALRRLFVTILVYCAPIGVRGLWDEFYPFMIEDYVSTTNITPTFATNRLLRVLNTLLVQFNKSINEFDLPGITRGIESSLGMTRCIEDEISIGIPQQDLDAIKHLNDDQRSAFNTIMGAIQRSENKTFFVDGPDGTGKTYLYCALLANLRRLRHIVLATTSSGIAATILPGGRTTHSKFKIPLSLDASSMSSINKQSDLAKLIQKTKAIIWDEATMMHHHAFEALNRTFRDLIDVDLPFGGKIMIFRGDFRQVLLVIQKGTKAKLIQASVIKASFWSHVKILKLKQNMRSINDREFSKFLLCVGDGNEDVIMDDMVKPPECMVIPWESEHSINQLIAKIFPDLEDHKNDAIYMVERAVVTPTNEDVDMLKEKIINMFPSLEETMYSFDSVEDDTRNLYQPEFLNSISLGGLPPHKLTMKRGAPIMLLRNIDPNLELCNGTRLLCRGSYRNFIDAEILTGQFVGSRVFLPIILLKSIDTAGLPFELTRK